GGRMSTVPSGFCCRMVLITRRDPGRTPAPPGFWVLTPYRRRWVWGMRGSRRFSTTPATERSRMGTSSAFRRATIELPTENQDRRKSMKNHIVSGAALIACLAASIGWADPLVEWDFEGGT